MRLKNILKIKAAHAAGHLIFLWLWAIDNAPDGDLSGLSAGDIAEISGWSGKKAEVFMDALIEAGFLDPDMKIHDWYEYAGKLIDQRQIQREQSRIRQQRHREKIANTSNDNALVTRDIDVSNADVTHSRVEKSKSRVDIYSLDGGVDINNTNSQDLDSIANDSLSKADDAADDRAAILKTYEESIGAATGTQAEYLWSFLDSMECPLILKAIEEAADNNARSFKYVKTVLSSWLTAGLKTLADYTAREAARAKQKARASPPKEKSQYANDEFLKPSLELLE